MTRSPSEAECDEKIKTKLHEDDREVNKQLHQGSRELLGLNKSQLDCMLPAINKTVPDERFDAAGSSMQLQGAGIEKPTELPNILDRFESVVITQGFMSERRKVKAP